MTSITARMAAATDSTAFRRDVFPSGLFVMEIIKAENVKSKFERTDFDTNEVYPIGTEHPQFLLKPLEPISVDDDELDSCPGWKGMSQFVDIINDRDTKTLFPDLVAACSLDLNEYIKAGGDWLSALMKDMLHKKVQVSMKRFDRKDKESKEPTGEKGCSVNSIKKLDD